MKYVAKRTIWKDILECDGKTDVCKIYGLVTP